MISEVAAAAGPRAIEVPTVAGAGALTASVVALLIVVTLLVRTRLARITPSGATIDLRPEPPAVADLLTGGFRVEDDAVPATVVDLAARGWFSIEDYGDDTIIRVRRTPPTNDTLAAFEQRVLSHIEHHAIDGVVPTRVLTTGQKGLSKRWFRGFSREVIHDAQHRGLAVRRWGLWDLAAVWTLASLALLPGIAAFSSAPSSPDAADWAAAGNILAGLSLVVAAVVIILAGRMSRLDAQRDTPAGVTAAAHWYGVREFYRNTGEFEDKSAASVAIWDRHLAYATALGLAARVQRQIPFESEHDRHAWSRANGQWRRVTVRYRTWRPGWGRHPLLIALTSMLAAVMSGAVAVFAWRVTSGTWRDRYGYYAGVTEAQVRWLHLSALIVAVTAVACTGWFVVRLVLGCADVFRRRTVEGDIIRARRFGGSDDTEPTYHLAIDTATPATIVRTDERDTLVAFKVRPSIYTQVQQGARVRAVVSPWLGYVTSIETLVPAPDHVRRLADSPNAFADLLGKWSERAGSATNGAAMGFITNLLARQEAGLNATQLDAVGPDGLTLRERIAASRAQLAAIGSTPPAGAASGAPRFRVVDPPPPPPAS